MEPVALSVMTDIESSTRWTIHGERLVDESRRLLQPMLGSADAENLLFISHGAEDTGQLPDINETQKVEWLPLASVPELIERGEVAGGASLVGLLHVLALGRN
jgi:hypothetical protein